MAAEPARSLSPAPASEPVRWPPWPEVAYPVWPDDLSQWYLPEDDDTMTWATLLTALQRHLLPCLRKLLEEQNRDWFVNYEQKMKLDPHNQRVGVCPDIYVLPCQPEDPDFSDWPGYLPGVPVPVFALEMVSPSNWEKDYTQSPQKYAKLGIEELLLFDDLAVEGKSPASDPYVLQLYRRGKKGELRRVYAGKGPVYSEALGGWFRTVGKRLTVTRDREGKRVIFTYEETERWWGKLEEEREAKKRAQEEAEQERSARKEAQAKAEQERQAREKADQERQAAQEKADQERQAREEAECKAHHEALARQQAEQAKKDAEAKAQQEALARQQAEQAKKDAEAKAQQEALARQQAEQQALDEARLALLELADVLQVLWTDARRLQVDSLDLAALRQLRAFLKQHKRWPT